MRSRQARSRDIPAHLGTLATSLVDGVPWLLGEPQYAPGPCPSADSIMRGGHRSSSHGKPFAQDRFPWER